ncbi:hypothetical protein R3W88_023511 [Solanum pinnatisectum]|uniref:PGG domain-containing protein n=1 Tax=Solanum pinnatisectum TaxID=50273 RepID=A0AAV9LXQ1_9SOLN|nr:hypothetical protein R3W88_023511 [Solanum pinnatisectum]
MESNSSHDEYEDNEQFESQDETDSEEPVDQHLNLTFLNGGGVDYRSVCETLYGAALKDNWKSAEPILKKNSWLIHQNISHELGSILHIATQAKSFRFLVELMKLMEATDLELKNKHENTAFCVAAMSGFYDIAKAMREKNGDLPNIRCGIDELLPIVATARCGHKAMVSYLYEITNLDTEERLNLLQITIMNEMYEVASDIFNKEKILAKKMLQKGSAFLYMFAQKSLAISKQEGYLKGINEVAYSPVWKNVIISAISMVKSQFITVEKNLLEKQAGQLFEELWTECKKNAEKRLLKYLEKDKLLHFAAKTGNVEFLVVAINNHPDLIWKLDRGWSIIHVAVLYREEKVFNLIHQIGAMKSLLIQKIDANGNNILHLAGRLGLSNTFDSKEKIMPPSFLRVSGAALQMQREILWFKEVEKLVPPFLLKVKNLDEKTPRELFTEEHKQLLKDGEKWMKDTANSCMLVASLIATMVFAVGFTVPGGNNSNNGIPILLDSKGFMVFVISDAVALFNSIVSIIMFLSILISRYGEDDFLVSLPTKLFFGLTALFLSIVSMLVAFAATFFLVYSKHTIWEPKLVIVCAGIPVALFGCLQYKLWFDVARSTYRSKFLFRLDKHKVC